MGKTWGLHLEKVVRVDRDENLAMIEESVAFLVAQGKRVIYDAEHFFDGWRDDREYALRCLRAAVDGGAERVVLCDTNGSSLPDQIAEATAGVHAGLDGHPVGIHCHDDCGVGVANSLAAVKVGRDARAGHDERRRRADRQREPRHDHGEPPAQAGLRDPARPTSWSA